MVNKKNITAIIFAGGESSRMGRDKGLIDFNGMKMIEHVFSGAKSLTDDVLIISNNPEYKKFGYPVCEDLHKNCGPLGGIHSGLSNSKTNWSLVIACDLPFITGEFLSFLISKISVADAIVPVRDSHIEPLCALYNKSALMKMESLLLKSELKMQSVLRHLDTVFVEVHKEKFNSNAIFKNINSPEDMKHRNADFQMGTG